MFDLQHMSMKRSRESWQMDGDQGKTFTNGMTKPVLPPCGSSNAGIYKDPLLPVVDAITGVVAAVPLASIPVKKFRIVSKQQTPVWFEQDMIQKYRCADIPWTIKTKMRDLYVSYTVSVLSADDMHEMPYDRLREMARQKWNESEEPMKALWWHRATTQPEYWKRDPTTPGLKAHIPAGINPKLFETEHQIRAMLLTWHGNWGEHEDGVTKATTIYTTHEDVFQDIRGLPYWQRLADRFFKFMQSAATAQGFGHVSIAIEMCMKSPELGKVHLHSMISGGKQRLTEKLWHPYTFDGFPVAHVSLSSIMSMTSASGKPNKKANVDVFGSAAALRRSREAHFYLQYDKHGMITQRTNYVKNQDFPVAKRWIWNALKIRKISLEGAVDECIEARDGARTAVSELEWLISRAAATAAQEESIVILKQIKANTRPFREKPPLVLEWFAQYSASGRGKLSRFKPLVLDGDTRLGKSSWVSSWFAPGEVLALNCQDISEPNMKEYNRKKHKCILFEEASWELVHNNKLLFQAGPYNVTCGRSATNCMAYEVFVYMVPMVICTNDFFGKIDPQSSKYVDSNVLYMPLQEKCYL